MDSLLTKILEQVARDEAKAIENAKIAEAFKAAAKVTKAGQVVYTEAEYLEAMCGSNGSFWR